MISEGSCDTDDGVMMLKIQLCITISQYYCFYCNFDQINAVLVSKKGFFQKKKKNVAYRKILNGSVNQICMTCIIFFN